MSAVTTLVLPGLFNSGAQHWQSRWEETDATCVRVNQSDWATPRCADWMATLDAAVATCATPVVLVAHSSSCALIGHWAQGAHPSRLSRVKGALLVGPSDTEGPNYPAGPTGFAPMPMTRLPFASIVVSSTNDIYVTEARARAFAAAWGSDYVDVGAVGHVNGDSGLGTWPQGYALLERLRQG